MDNRSFDNLTRLLGSSENRRSTLRAMGLTIAAGLGALISHETTNAGKGKGKGKTKGNNKKKPKCKGDQATCGKDCANLQSDNKHCGSCGNNCSQTGLTCCFGECIDTLTSQQNCGGCNIFCTEKQFCSNGSCVERCPGNLTFCNEQCIDTQFETSHCGGCGRQCGENETCTNGQCVCPTGIKCPLPDGSGNRRCCPAAGGSCCATGKCCAPGTTCSGTVCLFPD